MASDIATVGTALEVADGYKIQFNFYTTVALVMLFDFIIPSLTVEKKNECHNP